MTPRTLSQTIALLCLALLAAWGCARRPPAPAPREQKPPRTSAPHEIAESRITLADPDGRWTFEVRAEHIEAASIDGPYTIASAECRYQEVDRTPVLMRAARGKVDKRAGRVALEGSVWIGAGAWELEAARVVYDLKAGKVVAPGRTKWTFVRDRVADEKSEAPGEEKR